MKAIPEICADNYPTAICSLLERIKNVFDTVNFASIDHANKGKSVQGILLQGLRGSIHPEFVAEYRSGNKKVLDSVDLHCKMKLEEVEYSVIIEIDTTRADQVAKKFLSRMAIFGRENIIYITFCYPGTEKMSTNEVEKYMGYCNDLSAMLNKIKPTYYIGFMPDKN